MNEENKGEVTVKECEEAKARSNFLFVFNCLTGKYGIKFHDDVDVDFDNMVINVNTEMEDRTLLAFIAELEEITGRLK
jgi:hypothetical protein